MKKNINLKQLFCFHRWHEETIWKEEIDVGGKLKILSPVLYKKCSKCGKIKRI